MQGEPTEADGLRGLEGDRQICDAEGKEPGSRLQCMSPPGRTVTHSPPLLAGYTTQAWHVAKRAPAKQKLHRTLHGRRFICQL